MSLVNTDWLEKNLNKVKIIDCSWHMPQANRSGIEEYRKEHIPNAIFFDLDKNSKVDTDLPHMLTDINSWEKIMGNIGIENNDEIVIYDNSDVISSCRCWYNLIYFGHDPMIINEKGDFFGSVSGGCVEANVITECLELIKNNNSFKQIRFNVSDDSAWDVGLACGGEITIFIEQINS